MNSRTPRSAWLLWLIAIAALAWSAGQLDWPDGDLSDRQISIPPLDTGFPTGSSRDFGLRLTPRSHDIALGTAAEALELYSAVATTAAPPPLSTGGGAIDVWFALALLGVALRRRPID